MSETNEDSVYDQSVEVEVSSVKDDESEEPQLPLHITAEADLMESKGHDMKTIDALDNNDMSEEEQLNTRKSRELKLLLALSKEANLDINISHKRKSADVFKLRSMSPKPGMEVEQSLKKPRLSEKADKYPITAESELESVESGSTVDAVETPEKLKKEASRAEDVSIGKERRNIKDIQVYKPDKDMFCWRCHRSGVNISCETCPRSYHQKCLKQTIPDVENWPCPECVTILKAESTQTRSPAMKGMTLEHLCSLLKFAVKRMIECNGSEQFMHAVNDKDFPEYKNFIVQPMHLTLLEKNIKENLYGSTQAFEADAKWILHNSVVFNSYQSKLTSFAKTIIKICKQEMAEIENCPSCYLNANTKKMTWFVEVCPKPHILVWAKLKGFPYWPAKVMCTNATGLVDVRFFGAHDRAWVPAKECFLYSRRDPNSNKQKRNDIIECMREVEVYISNLKSLYGEFNYAPFKIPYDPDKQLKQLLLFLPRYNPHGPPPKKPARLSDYRARLSKKEDEDNVNGEESDSKNESDESTDGYDSDNEPAEKDAINNKEEKRSKEESELSSNNKSRGVMESSESEEDEEDKLEPELDDDTQVSSNASSDNVLRGKVKHLPRKETSDENPRKRISVDEAATPSKMTRRNSDQSSKSDSSRPALSDKISRVDILENVELSLGNTSDSFITSSVSSPESKEAKQKPVLMDVDNSELTISPKKVHITDKLMKKLTSSDEDTGKSSSDGDEDGVKSQTDILLEKYKNLVKEKSREFANIEASTSFGSTSIAPKDVCESTSENDEHESEKEIETELRSDIVISESSICEGDEAGTIGIKKSLSSEEMISSTENPESPVLNRVNITVSKSKPAVKSTESEVAKSFSKEVAKEDTNKRIIADESTKREDDTPAVCPQENDTGTKSYETNTVVTNNIDNEGKSDVVLNERDELSEPVTSRAEQEELKNAVPTEELSIKPITNRVPTKQPVTEDKDEKILGETPEVKTLKGEEAEQNTTVLQNRTARLPPTNKTVEREVRQSNRLVKAIPTGLKRSERVKINATSTPITRAPETMSQSSVKVVSSSNASKDNLVVSSQKKEAQVVKDKQEDEVVLLKKNDIGKKNVLKSLNRADSSSSDDHNNAALDEKSINQTSIRNIIHSSLNVSEVSKPSPKETAKTEKTTEKAENKSRRTSDESQTNSSAKKPRLEEHVNNVQSQVQFKIVPIQSILTNTIEDKPEQSIITSNPILLKKLCQSAPSKPIPMDTSQDLVCVEIKSEPESSDEEIIETDYMEKKREYMSALNISEKTGEASAPKKSEIRTRSKTEEMGKGRHLDNLSKIIDEVATTYSAKHESRRNNDRRIIQEAQVNNSTVCEETKRAPAPQENGEIFVKSFAKMPQQLKQHHSQSRQVQPKTVPNAQKPKSKILHQGMRREVLQKPNTEGVPTSSLSRTSSSATPNPQIPPATSNAASKPMENLAPSSNVLILTQPGVILPTSQHLTYNTGSFVTFVPSQQNMTLMQSSQVLNAMVASGPNQNDTTQGPRTTNVELLRSQNYIPQREDEVIQRSSVNNPVPPSLTPSSTTNSSTHNAHSEVPALIPINENASTSNASPSIAGNSGSTEDEFSLLHSLIPENVSKAINELLCRPPPKLKPRPPGPLSQVFDSGNPSSAGPVSAKINSISHRLGDYFRGLLVEMLEDLGKANNPEATISSLKHEIETLQHKHASELMDIRKNVCTILKDIQGSLAEERERLVDETRSACEVEALRRIEEAKSKQWCANCGKEAQFYCCWNTSYCDYPCQQKHWAKHMSKCTQHAGQPQPVQASVLRPQSQITFRPATPKNFGGRIVPKPTKVYLNRSNNPKSIPTFKTASGSHLALMDSTSLEFLTSTTMGAKFITSNSLFTKVKTVNSTVTSPSNGVQQSVVSHQKVNNSVQITKPVPSTSNNTANLISDEEFESE